MRNYRKTVIAIIAVILTGLNLLYSNNPIVQLIISLAAALGVYATPNSPQRPLSTLSSGPTPSER